MTEIANGMTARDVITGFEGLVTATADYLTGCNQALLTPRETDGNKRLESEWFDVERLEATDAPLFELPPGRTPSGRDEALPPGR